MPIIDMKKVYLLGHRQEREKVFSLLQHKGSVEMVDVKSGESWSEMESLLEPDQPDEAVSGLDEKLGEIRYCIDFLQRNFPMKKTFVQQFTGAKVELSAERYNDYIDRLDKTKTIYEECRRAEDELARIRNEETQCYNLIAELEPWVTLDVPIEQAKEGSFASMGLYQIPVDNLPELQGALDDKLPAHYLEVFSTGTDIACFFFACVKAEFSTAQELFKENTVTAVSFPELTGTPSQNIDSMQKKLDSLAEEREAVLNEVEGFLEHRPMLMACHDYMDNELKKHEAVMNLARTDNSFLLEGWVPEPVLADLETTMAEETDTAILVSRNPEPHEDVPVLLHNRGPADAYEVVTLLYSTPKKNELDPTPYLAPFFLIFFGICLSDAGYGLILTLLAIFVSRKLRLSGMGKQLMKLLYLGGFSAAVFGILFGGYFGDLFNLPPLWFNPLDDPMTMLIYCFAIGLVQIYFGLGLQAYRNIKAGKPLDALFDQGFWFIFLNGLIMLLLPGLALVGQGLAVGGGAGLILTQGRTQQGIIKKFMSGLLSLYNITGYLSDVLSYSRLLALGLATGVIAMAINAIGELVYGSIIGIVVMVVILAGGHLFNVVISSLTSYVHTSRLQYVEFFGKFFEGGGKSFRPFRVQTNYIDVTEREEA